MKGGPLAVPNSPIRQRIAAQTARLHTEAIVVSRSGAGQDVRQTYAQLDAGTKTNVTTYVEDAVRLTASGATGISHTAGTDDLTGLTPNWPFHLLAWELDESVYGPDLPLTNVQLYIDPQRDTGNPAFDGKFQLEVLKIREQRGYGASGQDLWLMQRACAPLIVDAGDISAAGLVAFTPSATTKFGETPPPIILDGSFVPARTGSGIATVIGGRVVVFRLSAYGGTNTNYSWKYESGASNPLSVASKGRLLHLSGAQPGPYTGAAGSLTNAQVSLSTGIPRATITVASFAATGSLAFTGGNQMNLGASPSGTVEFVVLADGGGTGAASARVNSGDAWTPVLDGQTPADVGLAVSQTYEMKFDFTANATASASPALRRLGIRDRVLVDFTEYATWSEPQESVNPLTGEVKIADAECRLQFLGVRDFRDDVTNLVADNAWNTVELRTHVYHPDLARNQWGLLDLWKLDNAVVTESEAVLSCVSILSELRGKYPRASGTLYGYLLKSAASNLASITGGHSAEWLHEISYSTETAGTLDWPVAGSATEYAYFVTPANVPSLLGWMAGDWTIKLKLSTGNTNIKLAVRLLRVTSTGTLLGTFPTLAYTTAEEITASTGLHTLTVANVVDKTQRLGFTAARTDRIAIEIRARNTDASAHTITFETGTTDTEIRPPWIESTSVAPYSFSDVTPAAAAATWLDTVIGLAARFRGALSDRAVWTVRKEVMDADGQRELERISFVDGLMPIASQGLVKQANLWGPRGLPVATFPLEVGNVQTADMGFGSRLPEYEVPYGFETNIPNDFAGRVKAQHAAAFTAFGRSKIDEPVPELEHETAKWIPDAGLAGEIGRAMVLNVGCGLITLDSSPTEAHPELELGDMVGVETNRLAFHDPVAGVSIKGYLWAFGRIIGKAGDLLPRFKVWVAGLADLVDVPGTPTQRQPYNGPVVTANVSPDPANVQNALVVLRAWPAGATIYYHYHADGTNPPERNRLELWSTYSVQLTLLRDTASDKILSAFAVYGGFLGAVVDTRISPSPDVSIGTLIGTESGTTFTAAASDISPAVREIRWYMRKDATNYPTDDGTTTGELDETYFVAQKPVDADAGGGTTQAHTGTTYAATNHAHVIAVPIDYNGKPGTRKTLDYTFAGATTPNLTAATWSSHTATAGAERKVSFAWTPSGVSDVTHDLFIFEADGVKARTQIKQEVSPNSVTSATGIGTGYTYGTGTPNVLLVYSWELRAGATVIASGTFKPRDGDEFPIGDGSVA